MNYSPEETQYLAGLMGVDPNYLESEDKIWADYFVGKAKITGNGLTKNLKEGLKSLTISAEAGCTKAMMFLYYEFEGFGETKKDITAAHKWLNRALEAGTPEAFYFTGLFYESGTDGFVQDVVQAVDLYQKAAEREVPQAALKMAQVYRFGQGRSKDPKEAEKWYRLAVDLEAQDAKEELETFRGEILGQKALAEELLARAKNGDASAQYQIWFNHISKKNLPGVDAKMAEEYMKQAAENGHPEAQTAMALSFKGKDDALCLHWMEKAAKGGDVAAQFGLGYLYYQGECGQNDLELAALYLIRAAQAGHPTAQFMLSGMYFHGKGVDKNLNEAFYWSLRASESERPEAWCNLALMYHHGFGTEEDLAEAVVWYQKAAEKDLNEAMFNLGNILYRGALGVPKDTKNGIFWLKKAAGKGHESSLINLMNIFKEISGKKYSKQAFKMWMEKV